MATPQQPVPFNRPLYLPEQLRAIEQALAGGQLAGNGPFTQRCEAWLRNYSGSPCALLTPSCTHALEMAALLIDVGPGDEVIMPSWTFVSTANAFVLRGATPVFVDVRAETGNLDERLIEAAITAKTRAIVPVHYGGVACDMDAIMTIAERHKLWVIEDAAQGLLGTWRGKALGAIGHLGAYSFHATKNYTSGGEGGALLVNCPELAARAEIIREKGTNRSAFSRGDVNRYQWLEVGSSYLPGELQAAALSVQLNVAQQVNQTRRRHWEHYYQSLQASCLAAGVALSVVPEGANHNGHLFFLLARDRLHREHLLQVLNADGVMAQSHYEPLHLSPAGMAFGRFAGLDVKTLAMHDTLLRLPIYYSLGEAEQDYVIERVRVALRS